MLKKLFILFALAGLLQACSEKDNTVKINTLDEISLSDVDISDDFWNQRIENNYKVSFLSMLDRYEENGGRPNPKLMEAGAYILHKNPDPELKSRIDANFDKLIGFYIPEGKVREWNRMLNGDLYGAGHFIEAASLSTTS